MFKDLFARILEWFRRISTEDWTVLWNDFNNRYRASVRKDFPLFIGLLVINLDPNTNSTVFEWYFQKIKIPFQQNLNYGVGTTPNESFFSHAQNKIQNLKNLKLPQSKIVYYNYLITIYNYHVYHCFCSHSDISGLNFFFLQKSKNE